MNIGILLQAERKCLKKSNLTVIGSSSILPVLFLIFFHKLKALIMSSASRPPCTVIMVSWAPQISAPIMNNFRNYWRKSYSFQFCKEPIRLIRTSLRWFSTFCVTVSALFPERTHFLSKVTFHFQRRHQFLSPSRDKLPWRVYKRNAWIVTYWTQNHQPQWCGWKTISRSILLFLLNMGWTNTTWLFVISK